MKAATFFVGAVALLGTGLYLKTKKPELYASIKAKLIPGGNGDFEVSDFYQPRDKSLFDKIKARLNIKDLTSKGWEEERQHYEELQKALAAKVDELNRLSTYEANSGEKGQELKDQAYATAKELNELEDKYTIDALEGREIGE